MRRGQGRNQLRRETCGPISRSHICGRTTRLLKSPWQHKQLTATIAARRAWTLANIMATLDHATFPLVPRRARL